MKKRIILFMLVLFTITSSFHLTAQGLTVNGLLDSTFSLRAGAGDAGPFSFGIEEFANIRMQARLRDNAIFYGAFNLFAVAGDNAAAAAFPGAPLIAGQYYAAGIELERLYFKLLFESFDMECGLLRLPFGYGQVWGPTDFLNPKNPLKPDARPRAVLGGGLSYYPTDMLKILGFGAAPKDPFSQKGEGGLIGVAAEQHWDTASIQGLYSYQTPDKISGYGLHRFGMSIKADVEVGMIVDILYTYDHKIKSKFDGLSFSIGFDYSFFEGKLFVLAEYLFNGKTSTTAFGYGGYYSNNNYLYTGATWSFNDFTNIGLALISGIDDVSFTPVITFNHDLFQGGTLTLTAQIPLDSDLFLGDGYRGEFGPIHPVLKKGNYFNFTARLRLRF
jgi:hypothetical protein